MEITSDNDFPRIEHLSKSFQEGDLSRQVLSGCSLTMARSEFVAIIGKSGTGKSTLLNLIPTLSVQENVTLPLELIGISLDEAQDRAAQLLTEVNLGDWLNTFPDQLSGGEQQRVAIARALVHDPLLVLADEPTGNLDEETGSQVLALLEKLTRQVGKNLILVTHSRDNAINADRIIEIREGCFVEKCVK